MINQIKIGDKAPDFILPDEKNRARSLKDFLGQKVVLVFFVGALTSKCTKERCDFRDSIARLIDLKAQVIGIDLTVANSNKRFSEKNRLPFPVLSDHKREVFEKYGLKLYDCVEQEDGSYACCWGEGCYPIAKPSIFVLDENGIVRYMWVSENPAMEPTYEEIEKVLESISSDESVAMVAPTVITISRQMGSGGDEIALEVSKVLGYAYFDKSLMLGAAKSIGVSEEEIADFSEDTYKVKGFVDKILQRKKPAVIPHSLKDNEQLRKTLDEEECLSAIQVVISSLASRGKTVIVGRGGQAILRHKLGVLHIRIIAPLDIRVRRIMKSEGLSQKAALSFVEDNDKAQAEYLRRFYNIDWEDPMIYDMVLNTGKMSFDISTRVIVTAASQVGN
ncbi:MAG: cytidylate kinase family protein [Bacillota bacterium]